MKNCSVHHCSSTCVLLARLYLQKGDHFHFHVPLVLERASISKMSASTHFSGAHRIFSSFLFPLHNDLLSAPCFPYPSLLSYPFALSWVPWCHTPVTDSRPSVTIPQRHSCCQESLGSQVLHHLPFPLPEEELLRKEGDGILLKTS